MASSTKDLTIEQRLERLESLFPEDRIVSDRQIMFVLEDVIGRACKDNSLGKFGGLIQFTDWLRGLYPELYTQMPKS